MADSLKLRLVQMGGAPGTGKTTLARALGAKLRSVVLTSDIIKSAMLDCDVEWSLAGSAGYATLFALAADLLDQHCSVVIDSPSHYPAIPSHGQTIARQHRADYWLVECICDDLLIIDRRLTGRRRLRSQFVGVGRPSADGASAAKPTGLHQWRTYGPSDRWVRVDTTHSLESCVDEVVQALCG